MSRAQRWISPLPGRASLLAGLVMSACFAGMAVLAAPAAAEQIAPLGAASPGLRGPQTPYFLGLFFLAGAAYLVAAACRARQPLPPAWLWGFAILFRLLLLFSPPTLSDDVYRYQWDGHLLNAGVNPYRYPVNAAELDAYTTPLRSLVNHAWMASPYLPAAQLYFGALTRLAPYNPAAFQIGAALLDLAAGSLIVSLLGRLGCPRHNALLYLWNPLVVVEFAHAAHIDALMLCALLLGLALVIWAEPPLALDQRGVRSTGRQKRLLLSASALALAAATLTKGLPLLFLPLLVRRWSLRDWFLYAAVVVGACVPFVQAAGWGLAGPLDGRGVFGAIRIFSTYWNYNSGLYHWLEVWWTGYATPGGVPVEAVGLETILIVRAITGGLTLLAVLLCGWLAWRLDVPVPAHRPESPDYPLPVDSQTLAGGDLARQRRWLRLALLPAGAYLLLTHTIHPWYVALVLPLLPFLPPAPGEHTRAGGFVWPWLYFSLAVALSYLTYLDPANLREFAAVRRIEYLPFYGLLIWAFWPYIPRFSALRRYIIGTIRMHV